jgi:hypothetical protein
MAWRASRSSLKTGSPFVRSRRDTAGVTYMSSRSRHFLPIACVHGLCGKRSRSEGVTTNHPSPRRARRKMPNGERSALRRAKRPASQGARRARTRWECQPELLRNCRASRSRAARVGVGQEGLEPSANLRERGEGGDAGQRAGSIQERSEPSAPVATPGPASEGGGPDSIDVVEVALAKTIEAAIAEGRWAIVAQLGRELEARRRAAGAPNVVAMDRGRRDR